MRMRTKTIAENKNKSRILIIKYKQTAQTNKSDNRNNKQNQTKNIQLHHYNITNTQQDYNHKGSKKGFSNFIPSISQL